MPISGEFSGILEQVLEQVYMQSKKNSDANFNTGCKFSAISNLALGSNEKLSCDSYSDIGVIIKLKSIWLDRPNLLVIVVQRRDCQ